MSPKTVRPPKFKPQTLKRLLGYLAKYRCRFALVLVCIFLSSLVSVISSVFLRLLFDDYLTPLLSQQSPNFSPLLGAIGVMALVYGVGIIVTYAAARLMIPVVQNVLRDIRDQLFNKMQRLPLKYYDQHPFGDVMSRFSNDVDTLEDTIARSLPSFASSLITIILVVITMVVTSAPLALVVALSVTLVFQISGQILKRSHRYYSLQQQALGATNGFIEEMIAGVKVVKVFAHEKKVSQDFARYNHQLFQNAEKANRYASILMPVMVHLGNLQYVLLAFIGGIMLVQGWGGITLGIIASFLQLSRNLSMPLGQISQQLNSVVQALAGAERVFKLLDEKEEVDQGSVTLVKVPTTQGRTGSQWVWQTTDSTGKIVYVPQRGEVVFDQVCFAYDQQPVLKNLSFTVAAGQKIAFVGATGAGKTTITNLLNRFYELNAGKILLDGIAIQEIGKSSLRRSLGMVLQDTHLFTGTISDNIRYGKLEATPDEVVAAAKIANAHDFIKRLPRGYATVIDGDDADLSSGQKQLLSIARAAISDPPVLILDEATASIDTRTETLVQQGMDNLMRGRTVLIIAHRLSTVRSSEKIIVLEHGEIIETGTHTTLLRNKGEYYQLYTGALELD
jgi:ATP-binding cassette subfamily B protein